MKFTAVLMASTLLTAGAVIGVSAQQFASADVSSGDRPVLVPIEPCRLVDTRPAPGTTIGPRSGPLGGAESFTVDASEVDTLCTGKIPVAAGALSLNVTAVNATEQTFLTIWPEGPRPLASSLNPAAGSTPVPNAVTTQLSPTQTFEIYNDAGSVNVIVDVNGYYEHHDHDDRYYTEAEVDNAFDSVDASQLGGHPASDYPRIRAIIRMVSGIDGYTVEQGIDPGFTVTTSSPSVFRIGASGSSARSAMESANCTSGFSNVQFSVYKALDLGVTPFAAELHLLQPDGSPLPFNGRAVFCTIWE